MPVYRRKCVRLRLGKAQVSVQRPIYHKLQRLSALLDVVPLRLVDPDLPALHQQDKRGFFFSPVNHFNDTHGEF